MSEKNTEIREGLDQDGKACGSEGEAGERLNEKDTEGHPKVRDGKLEEDLEWPCGVCGDNVTVDGVRCADCNKWCHVDGCTEITSPNEYLIKPYTCSKCLEKGVDKAKKKKKPGRRRRNSIPTKLTEEDWTANKDWIEKNIESRIKSKRNINEVGSPEKNETQLEEKKRKTEGEGTEKKDEEKKVDEEESTSLLSGSVGKGSEHEEIDKDDRQLSDNNRETNDEGGEIKTDNKKGKGEGKNDKKMRCIDKKKEEGEKSGKKEVKHVENREHTEKIGSNTVVMIRGIEFTKEDIDSLEDRKYLTCTGISLGITHVIDDAKDIIKENKILFIRPEIAQIFQHGDRESIKQHKEIHKTKEHDWIFYPVNNNKPGEVYGGTHWSLLIFSRRDHAFYHFDPLDGINEKHAKRMITNLMDEDSYDERGVNLPAFFEGNCAQQRNGYDCGPYVIQYMRRAAFTIGEKKGRGFGDMHPDEWILEEPRRDLKNEVQLARHRIEAAWANTSRASELRASMHEEEITKKLREKGEEKDIEIISDQSSDIEMEDTEQTDEKGWTKVGRKSTARKSYTNQTEKKGRH